MVNQCKAATCQRFPFAFSAGKTSILREGSWKSRGLVKAAKKGWKLLLESKTLAHARLSGLPLICKLGVMQEICLAKLQVAAIDSNKSIWICTMMIMMYSVEANFSTSSKGLNGANLDHAVRLLFLHKDMIVTTVKS